MRGKVETRNLPVKLTRDELDHRRDKIADMVHEIGIKENQKKDMTAQYGKEIKKLEDGVKKFSREVRTRTEYREVDVVREKNFILNIEEIRRADTMELVDSRALEPRERQMEIHSARSVECDLRDASEAARRRKKKELEDEARRAAEQAQKEAESGQDGNVTHLHEVAKDKDSAEVDETEDAEDTAGA